MASAKAKFKFKRRLERIVQNKKMMERIGRYATKRIKDETRKGRSLATDSKLRPLTRFTIDLRKRMAIVSKTSTFFKPSLSNATFSGQLLNSLIFIIKKQKAFKNRLFITANEKQHRPPRVTKKKKRQKKLRPISNKEVLEEYQDKRPILGMDAAGREQILRIVLQTLRRELRRARRK